MTTHSASAVAEADVQMLLAIDRAGDENPGPDGERYEYRGPVGSADCEAIARHLGGWYARYGDMFVWEGYRPESARASCKRLQKLGLVLEHRPANGKVHYSVSPDGDELLRDMEVDPDVVMPDLPESPGHRTWREKREAALAAVAAIREDLRAKCATASAHVDDEAPDEMWVGERRHDWRNLGSEIEKRYEDLIKALCAINAPEPTS